MKIKTALFFWREARYIKSVLKRYGDSLAVGRYSLLNSFRALSLNEDNSLSQSLVYFGGAKGHPRMASLAKVLNRIGYYTNKNKRSTQEFEAFYTSNNYNEDREVKLFSYKKGLILTICTTADEAEKQMSQYLSFSAAYAMPKAQKSDRYPNSIEISMIDKRESFDYKDALIAIMDSCVRFNSDVTDMPKLSARELIKHSYDDESMNSLLEDLCSKIDPSLLDLELPQCIQHGDLSKDNLIYGESDRRLDFWWIDWEHVNERVFFYDLFFYIINSAIYYDKAPYDIYFGGQLDSQIKIFFEHFGLTFDPDKRKDYFVLFAVVFLKERVCAFSRIEALKKYCEFIDTN